MRAPLPLRDLHPGNAPDWWPPAPGWWMVAALTLIVAALLAGWRLNKRRHRMALLRLFDESVGSAQTPAQQVAAMSELLRRAARRLDPSADRMEGSAWLAFLDEGIPSQPFGSGAGALLLDGGFREQVAGDDVAALRIVARQRYLLWMERR